MTDLRTAAQQALWALEMLAQPTKTNSETPRYKAHKAAITALRAALAQQTQTPCDIAEDGVCEVIDCCRNSTQEEQEPKGGGNLPPPLQAKQEEQEERQRCAQIAQIAREFARAIEAALKEKNA